MDGILINDRYEVDRTIGKGGQGVTLLATDRGRKNTPVIVKVYYRARLSDRASWEFGQLARLDHDGIVGVHELGVIEAVEGPVEEIEAGQGFLVQEWIDGMPSSAFVHRAREKSEGWIRTLGQVTLEVAESLMYLHERRLLHRDLKPGHVLVRSRRKLPRCVLIDFGLSLPVGDTRGGLTGTPGYIAPECLAGQYTPATDLYALGATVYRLSTGERPVRVDGRSTARNVIEAILKTRPRPAGDLCPALPSWMAELVDGLLAADPSDRPPSARAVVDHLARHVGGRRRARRRKRHAVVARPPLRGRKQIVHMLVDAATRRLDQPAGPADPVIVLEAPRGMGKSAVIDEVKRRVLIARGSAGKDFPRFLEGSLRDLAQYVGGDRDQSASVFTGPPVEEIVASLSSPSAVGPGLVLVIRDLDDHAGRVVAGLAGRLSDRAARPLPLLIVVERDTDQKECSVQLDGLEGIAVVKLGPLDRDHVDAIARFVMGSAARDDAVEIVVQRSSGNPLWAIEMAGRIARSGLRKGSAGLPETLEDLVDQAVADLGGTELAVLRCISLGPEGMDISMISEAIDVPREEVFGALESLSDRGWAVHSEQIWRPASVVAGSVVAKLDEAQGIELTGKLAGLMQDRGLWPQWQIALFRLRSSGEPGDVDVVLDGAAQLSSIGEPARAIELVREALVHVSGRRAASVMLDLARLYRETGQYEDALELLEDSPSAEGRLELARCLRLMGRPQEARPILEDLLEATDGSSDEGVAALTLLARMHVDFSEPQRAIDLLGDRDLSAVADHNRASVLEPLGMALAAVGREDDALEAFDQGALLSQSLGRSLEAARFRNLQGRANQQERVFGEALTAYEQALELARTGGDSHAQGVYAMNLGATLTELCRYDEAHRNLSTAHQILREIGEVRELPLALFNLAVLHSRIGDPEGSMELAHRGRTLAARQRQPGLDPYFGMLEGDAARARGDLESALAAYDDAVTAFEVVGDVGGKRAAVVNAADAATLLGESDVATERLSEARRVVGEDPEGDDPLVLAAARLTTDTEPGMDGVLARLEGALDRARARGDLEAQLRINHNVARLAGPTDPRYAQLRTRTLELAAMLRLAASPLGYNPLRADPELRAIERMEHMVLPESDSVTTVPSVPSSGQENKWKRLVRINKRLNSELRLRPLLETILDTLVDLTGATRGFILIRGKDGALNVKAARNIDQAGLPGGKKDFSASIVSQVVETGRPLITVDAAEDERFDALRSVHDLALKSVLCVPLIARGKVTGAVYVDNPYSSAIFGGEDVELVMDFADQASIAIENARLMAENRRRELRIERLNRKLEKALRKQQIELRGLRETIDKSLPVASGGPRRYPEIVGDSEPMLRMFGILDRIVESELPAIVSGESGTGKELVARAIHFHGPRKRAPFVSENCGAIPDTLLESVLFGHVKGAFTGADRDRPGLFEVASTGTLFLDEISSMSQTMQTKLLRALQEGIIRPLGGAHEQKVDVRIIAASNRDLMALVRDGSFREDLYYRINVVDVQLPALRERREDIPALVSHFIEKHARDRQVQVTPAALSRLMAHSWPGNVRELENEVMRALVLGGENIDDGLVLAGKELGDPSEIGDDDSELDLRDQVERLERSMIRKALTSTRGNQSAAARALGISRYGLIKKMRRLGI